MSAPPPVRLFSRFMSPLASDAPPEESEESSSQSTELPTPPDEPSPRTRHDLNSLRMMLRLKYGVIPRRTGLRIPTELTNDADLAWTVAPETLSPARRPGIPASAPLPQPSSSPPASTAPHLSHEEEEDDDTAPRPGSVNLYAPLRLGPIDSPRSVLALIRSGHSAAAARRRKERRVVLRDAGPLYDDLCRNVSQRYVLDSLRAADPLPQGAVHPTNLSPAALRGAGPLPASPARGDSRSPAHSAAHSQASPGSLQGSPARAVATLRGGGDVKPQGARWLQKHRTHLAEEWGERQQLIASESHIQERLAVLKAQRSQPRVQSAPLRAVSCPPVPAPLRAATPGVQQQRPSVELPSTRASLTPPLRRATDAADAPPPANTVELREAGGPPAVAHAEGSAAARGGSAQRPGALSTDVRVREAQATRETKEAERVRAVLAEIDRKAGTSNDAARRRQDEVRRKAAAARGRAAAVKAATERTARLAEFQRARRVQKAEDDAAEMDRRRQAQLAHVAQHRATQRERAVLSDEAKRHVAQSNAAMSKLLHRQARAATAGELYATQTLKDESQRRLVEMLRAEDKLLLRWHRFEAQQRKAVAASAAALSPRPSVAQT